MNQILETKQNNKKSRLIKLKKFLKIQFYFSLLLIIFIISYVGYTRFKLYTQEKNSNSILESYNITKLYTNNLDFSIPKTYENSSIIGLIEIKKLNIYYPVFSSYDDELLKISPCRFYGPLPGKVGNLCIAGHNYDNDKFFSKISTLNKNDEIIIYNSSNKKFSYYVSDVYEVNPNDLSPVYSYDTNSKWLTLITCNNFNNNRIVVKAFCEN